MLIWASLQILTKQFEEVKNTIKVKPFWKQGATPMQTKIHARVYNCSLEPLLVAISQPSFSNKRQFLQ